MGHFIALLYRFMSSGGQFERGVITQQAGTLSGPSGDQTPTHLHRTQHLFGPSSRWKEIENVKRLGERDMGRERGEKTKLSRKPLTFGQ